MATKALTTKVSGRAENKRARLARRGEIETRWHERQALRMFADYKSKDVDDVIDQMLWFGRWVSHNRLLNELSNRGDGDRETWGRILTCRLLRIVELKEMDYDDYLKTPEWKNKAERTKAKYDGCCALDEKPSVDAHHRTYTRRGRELPNDLVPLCRECHAKFHNK